MGEKFSDEELSIAIFQGLEDVEMRQLEESRRDIHESRTKLGQFSLGFMMEAVYGEEYAAKMRGELGDELYEMKMADIRLETKSVNGGVSTKLAKDLMEKMPKTKQTKEAKQELQEMLDRQEESIEFGQMVQMLSEMSQEERSVLMKLANKMEKKR